MSTETEAARFVAEYVGASRKQLSLLDAAVSHGGPPKDSATEAMHSGFFAQYYAMAYLMQILRTVAPDIADRAAADLNGMMLLGGPGVALTRREHADKLWDALMAGDPDAWKLFEIIGDREDLCDEYHSIRELYRFRLLYNAGLFNEWAAASLYDVHKSRLHHDGEVPFGNPNLFKVTAQLPTGQISNHYAMKDWDLFWIPERERAAEWDGTDSTVTADRLAKHLAKPIGATIVWKRLADERQIALALAYERCDRVPSGSPAQPLAAEILAILRKPR